jgi:hypothetical protein
VFVVGGGTVRFTKVELGIAGQEYFEALFGVQVGDPVVPARTRRSATSGTATPSAATRARLARNHEVVMQPVNGRRVLWVVCWPGLP